MTRLIIARHGNTFESGEEPRRIGRRTDLPLTEKGREQAKAIGRYLRDERLIPDVVYCSNLKRTEETARLAIRESGVTNPVFALDIFDEIDYGPDEDKSEDALIARIGEDAITRWNEEALPPPGWDVDPDQIIRNWFAFADQISAFDDNETVLVVTSNGIARFAPHLTGDFDSFRETHALKLAPGALGLFVKEDGAWAVREWNQRPD